MILGDRVYKVTDQNGTWMVIKRSDPTADLYLGLGWKVEEAFIFTKEEYDTNLKAYASLERSLNRNATMDELPTASDPDRIVCLHDHQHTPVI